MNVQRIGYTRSKNDVGKKYTKKNTIRNITNYTIPPSRSNFTSKIIWNVIFLNTIGKLLPSSRKLKATSKFFISFLVASYQYVFTLILSISTASSYVAGIEIPNFVFFLTLMTNLLIIAFLDLRSDGTHHENAGYLSVLFAFSHSVISMGLVSFIYLRAMYEYLPESHFTLSFHLLVVITLLLSPFLFS